MLAIIGNKIRLPWQIILFWLVGMISLVNIVAINVFPLEQVRASIWIYAALIVYISAFFVTSNAAIREKVNRRKAAWIFVSTSFFLLICKSVFMPITRNNEFFITVGIFLFTILGLIIYFPKSIWSLGNTLRVICDILLLSFSIISMLQSFMYYFLGVTEYTASANSFSVWVGFEIAGLINTIFLWQHYRQRILVLIVLAAICIVLADITGTIRQWYPGVYRISGLPEISLNHIQKMAVMLFAYYSVDHFIDPPADEQRLISRAEWRYRTGLPRLAGFVSLGVAQLIHPPDLWVIQVLVLVGVVQIGVSTEEEHRLVERAFQTTQQLLKANAELRAVQERLRQALKTVGELAVQEERRRLVLEIHDDIGHHMTNLMRYLEEAAIWLTHNLHKAQELFRVAEAEARQAYTGLRHALEALSTAAIANQPLDAWLHNLVRECLYQGLLAELYVEGEPQQLPPDVQHALYRVAQEAVTNIKKHARASEIMFKITYRPDTITMQIHDDGVGISDPNRQHGRGLQHMRERIEQIGGSFQIDSAAGQGVAIRAVVAFTHEQEGL